MDPNATYRELLAAIADGDGEQAREHARNLQTWIAGGGFLPSGVSSAEVNATIRNAFYL